MFSTRHWQDNSVSKQKYNKKRYELNKEQMWQWNKAWRENNPEKHKKNKLNFSNRNRARILAKDRVWRSLHPGRNSVHSANHSAAKLKALPKWANEFFIKEAYSLARLRTKLFGFKWDVDHIVPLQSKIVCGLHCEHNLQVIPKSLNLTKANRKWPDMTQPQHDVKL